MTELLRRWRLILGPAAEGGEGDVSGQSRAIGSGARRGTAGAALTPGQRATDAKQADRPTESDTGTDGSGVSRAQSSDVTSNAPGSGNRISLGVEDVERDRLLEALYGREYGARELGDTRSGGRHSEGLNAPDWLTGVRRLFPARCAEYLQREGLQRYGLTQLLTDRRVLAQATPDMSLVRTLISCRSLLPPAAMSEARRIIRQVIDALERRLSHSISARFAARRQRGSHGGPRRLSELDWTTTLRRNLRHYDGQLDTLVLRQLYFHARQRRHLRWELVLLVDQSGSMLDSIIHAAVLAAVLCGVRTLKTRLVLFDTRIVDLGDQLQDPVETLLGVQLGGGTDIAGALHHAGTCLSQPSRSLIVLISDFHEGGEPGQLEEEARRLTGSGVRLLGLAALDREAQPDYDHAMAQRLADCGMPVAALTPEHLADWIAEQTR